MQTNEILLVEDEMLLREVTCEDLEDLGFMVHSVGTSAEALRLCRDHSDLACLVTDIRMPGEIDGWELARRVRALRPNLPIIYISGYSEEGMASLDNAVFVRKPYRLEQLKDALRQLGL